MQEICERRAHRGKADGRGPTAFRNARSGGMVTTNLASGDDFGNAVIVLPTGKIVVAGAAFSGTTFDLALVGYTASGALDPSFGVGGKVFTDIGSTDDEVQTSPCSRRTDRRARGDLRRDRGGVLPRALRGGRRLDAGFGSGGSVTTDFGSGDAQGQSVASSPTAGSWLPAAGCSDPTSTSSLPGTSVTARWTPGSGRVGW